ncbi:MAG: beta-galactosidase trimerization domain-containing protein [Acidobacteriaceae bacterium]|nr:beta-galactosidase trimerization domain-containing protein [Acidobacteriaceae bacterium]
MWLNETVASGMVPWYHFIGGEDGLGADRRWQPLGHEYFNWLARHDAHFVNKRSIANLGVVLSQRTQLFYKPPGTSDVSKYMHGLYYALVEGRFLFDFVHEDDLESQNLSKYQALILPNVALLSDTQCEQLRNYVRSGGSLLATFETSLYDEQGRQRTEFALADVFGIRRAGDIITARGNSNPYLARIERQHEIVQGFSNTDWIPGAQFRIPISPAADPVLTVVPPYPAYPPEVSYPPVPKTDEPAVALRETGQSRLIYLPGDVDGTAWISGNTDLSRLLQNCVRWILKGETPVTIRGEGVIESFAWETKAGIALHLLNYTNPNMHKGWIRDFYAIGEQHVEMRLPDGHRVSAIQLLRQESSVPFERHGDVVAFRVPKIVDYEVVAVV